MPRSPVKSRARASSSRRSRPTRTTAAGSRLRPAEVPFALRMRGLAEEAAALRRAQGHATEAGRYEQAMIWVSGLLTALQSPNSLRVFSVFSLALTALRDDQLEVVRRGRFEYFGDDVWRDAYDQLSEDALRIGIVIRWIRWPNPTDSVGRVRDRAIRITEVAVAALAEPSLTTAQRDYLYEPFDEVIPQRTL
jgi:hypothetical protein